MSGSQTPADGELILVVDDSPVSLGSLVAALQTSGYRVLEALTGTEALKLAAAAQPDAILLDVRMPDMDGFEVCRRLKAAEATRETPVLFVSAVSGTDNKVKGLQAGAVDYLIKPTQQDEVLARLAIHLSLRRLTASLQAQNNRLALSNEVAQQITKMSEPDKMLQMVVSLIQSRLKYYFIGVWLFDDQKNGLVLQANESSDGIRPFDLGFVLDLEKQHSIVMACFRSLQPYDCPDVRIDPNFMSMEELPETRSELALPLRVGPLMLGVIDFHSDRLNAFGSEDQSVLAVLANQISVAVQNSQLYNSIRRFSEHLEELVNQRTEELREAYAKLEQIDQSKTKFIDVAAHELRTPLTIIRGYTQLLDQQVADRPQAQALIENIVSGVDRLNVVVNSMLDIAKINAEAVVLSPAVTMLAQIVRGVLREMARAAADRNITFRTEELERLPHIEADSALLVKVFYHLIANAIKYTPDGGMITIRGRATGAQDGQPAGVEVSVQDTGIGIDAQYLKLIFEQFYQTGSVALHSSGATKFKGGGPGLGLPIARGIVLAHGGRIWAESPGYDEEKLPGSTFYVWLPTQPQNLSKTV